MIPRFDMISKEAKIIEIKCPRCGAINLVISKISGNIIVELKE